MNLMHTEVGMAEKLLIWLHSNDRNAKWMEYALYSLCLSVSLVHYPFLSFFFLTFPLSRILKTQSLLLSTIPNC